MSLASAEQAGRWRAQRDLRATGWTEIVDYRAIVLGAGFACQDCGCDLSEWFDATPERLPGGGDHCHFDHIVPLSQGGWHRQDNVQLLCVTCHYSKSAGERAWTAQERRLEKERETEEALAWKLVEQFESLTLWQQGEIEWYHRDLVKSLELASAEVDLDHLSDIDLYEAETIIAAAVADFEARAAKERA